VEKLKFFFQTLSQACKNALNGQNAHKPGLEGKIAEINGYLKGQ
jgi:hypothetical protein